MSNRSEAFVGTAGMKDKKRGLSAETMAVARCSEKTERIFSGSLGFAPISPASRSLESPGACPPKSSGTGSSDRRLRQ